MSSSYMGFEAVFNSQARNPNKVRDVLLHNFREAAAEEKRKAESLFEYVLA